MHTNNRPLRPLFATPTAVSTAIVAIFVPLAAYAQVGEIQVLSVLGQPFRAVVPFVGQAVGDLEPKCFRIVRSANVDGLPMPNDLRIDVEDGANGRRLLVRTRTAVQEPAIRFGVEILCGAAVRSEYTVLLDPPSITEAVALPPTNLPIASTVSAPVVVSPYAEPLRTEATPSAAMRSAQEQRVPRPRRARVSREGDGRTNSVSAPRLGSARLRVKGSADGISRELDLTALAAPRLQLSATLLQQGGSGGLNEVDRAVVISKRDRILTTPVDVDIRPQLEVDLMIAQKRIAEMQARLASGTGEPAKVGSTSTAGNAPATITDIKTAAAVAPANPIPQGAPTIAAASPPKVSRDPVPSGGSNFDWFLRWLWVPASLAGAALVGALLWLNRKRRQEDQARAYARAAAAVGLSPDVVKADQLAGGYVNTHSASPNTRLPNSIRQATVLGDPMPSMQSVGNFGVTTIKGQTGQFSSAISGDLFQPNFNVDNVGVSMVSAITEEASVYIDLGRMDEAVAVLKDHIDLERAYNRATPAPWLMLLDLYHRADNRTEFDALREEFKTHFNGRVPEWGAFNEATTEKALADHEHILERLQRYWATPKCHLYIHKLLFDHRDNSRIGFSLTAYRELVLLDGIHSSAFPPVEQVGVELPED